MASLRLILLEMSDKVNDKALLGLTLLEILAAKFSICYEAVPERVIYLSEKLIRKKLWITL